MALHHQPTIPGKPENLANRRAHNYTFYLFGIPLFRIQRADNEVTNPDLLREVETMKQALEALAVAVSGLADLLKNKPRQ